MAEKKKAKESKKPKTVPNTVEQWELLLLWAILGEGGGQPVSRPALEQKGMLPSDDKKARDALENRGLIKVEKGARGSKILSVTRSGLAWAEDNLAAPPASSKFATPVLQAWLRRLSLYMSAHEVPLTAILGLEAVRSGDDDDKTMSAPRPVPTPLALPDYDVVRARIRQAYLDLTGGRLHTRALLSDLREKLQDIDRTTLDDALKRMQREEKASLYQLDNQIEITEADRAAAIYFGDEPRHILWIER